jgi:glutamine cyclotransferase
MVCIYVFACDNGTEGGANTPGSSPDTLIYSIKKALPHDTSSFTEGLLIYKNFLYESSGDPD